MTVQKIPINWRDRINLGVWHHAWPTGNVYGHVAQLCDGVFLYTPFETEAAAMAYVPDDSYCYPSPPPIPDVFSSIRFSGENNDVAAYGVTQITITANGEPFVIECLSTESWRAALISAGNESPLLYANGIQLNIDQVFDTDLIYLSITNSTTGTAIDSFEIELTLDVGSVAALHNRDGNATYQLVDDNQAHATFQLARGV